MDDLEDVAFGEDDDGDVQAAIAASAADPQEEEEIGDGIELNELGFPKGERAHYRANGHGALSRTIDYNDKSYPICGHKNQRGGICGLKAGHGTDHPGEGPCNKHGGNIGRKTALTKSLSFPGLQIEVDNLRENRDIFDLREHIFLLEGMAKVTIEAAESAADLIPAQRILREAVSAIKALHEIEVGRRLVIDINGVSNIISDVVDIIKVHVKDEATLAKISKDIIDLKLSDDDSGAYELEKESIQPTRT